MHLQRVQGKAPARKRNTKRIGVKFLRDHKARIQTDQEGRRHPAAQKVQANTVGILLVGQFPIRGGTQTT